jgi:hypothetical protein
MSHWRKSKLARTRNLGADKAFRGTLPPGDYPIELIVDNASSGHTLMINIGQ